MGVGLIEHSHGTGASVETAMAKHIKALIKVRVYFTLMCVTYGFSSFLLSSAECCLRICNCLSTGNGFLELPVWPAILADHDLCSLRGLRRLGLVKGC